MMQDKSPSIGQRIIEDLPTIYAMAKEHSHSKTIEHKESSNINTSFAKQPSDQIMLTRDMIENSYKNEKISMTSKLNLDDKRPSNFQLSSLISRSVNLKNILDKQIKHDNFSNHEKQKYSRIVKKLNYSVCPYKVVRMHQNWNP